jgi:phosphatidylethanolamine-binding protein (PEBP) family uncharacterized protein
VDDYKGSSQGESNFRRVAFGGLCPPEETHSYIFRLYALGVAGLNLKEKTTREEVLKAANGNVIPETKLAGAYSS